jgi:hypothetical protein
MSHRPLLALTGLACLSAAFVLLPSAGGNVAAPATPELYDARIHYRINAFRNERVVQYNEMLRYLQAHGFRRDPEDEPAENEAEDAEHTMLRGTIPGREVDAIARERHVRAVLLVPHGTRLPEKAQPVRLDVTLAGGLPPEAQVRLHEQAREVLASVNFREAVGYDNRGFARLVGAMPADRIDTLLGDLRKLPAGARQGPPFSSVWPLRVAVARPDLPLPAGRPRPVVVPPGQEKLTADLRAVLDDKDRAARPMRLEAILADTPAAGDHSWRRRLTGAVPGLVLEGRVGPVVAVVLPPAQAPALAAMDDVVAVRLPRPARPGPEGPGSKSESWKPLLESSGLARLHDLRHRGKGMRVAVIDSDCSGWQALVGKRLPATTRLVDLTAERNPDVLPDPTGPAPGPGTQRAVTLSRAAPEADLTLIRVDPAAPWMIYQAARAIAGDDFGSVSLDNRVAQMEGEHAVLDRRREQLARERREAFENFEEEGEGARRREEYRKHQAEFDRDERAYIQRLQRYLDLVAALRRLAGIRVVTSGLVWDDGFPVDGTSALSRYFDDRPFRHALWFQAAGDARGQSWVGPFRDADGNGVLEFAPPDAPLPADAWTHELNFLGWRNRTGWPSADIPARTRLRVSVQWHETHEGLYRTVGEDRFREPLARVRLLVLRQLDPEGRTRPADDLEVVAQSSGLPQRISETRSGATYEQSVEFEVSRAGRFAVRVEARPPAGTLPRGEPELPAAHREAEMRLRLFVTTLEGAGRAVWHDFATDDGSVGMPADANTAVTVGAANGGGSRQAYSAGGAPFGLGLLVKPDVLAFDDGEGTAGAAAFAAGLTAIAATAGPSLEGVLPTPMGPGGLLRIPSDWPRLPPRAHGAPCLGP